MYLSYISAWTRSKVSGMYFSIPACLMVCCWWKKAQGVKLISKSFIPKIPPPEVYLNKETKLNSCQRANVPAILIEDVAKRQDESWYVLWSWLEWYRWSSWDLSFRNCYLRLAHALWTSVESDFLNLKGKRILVRVIGRFEKSRVQKVREIGIPLYFTL